MKPGNQFFKKQGAKSNRPVQGLKDKKRMLNI